MVESSNLVWGFDSTSSSIYAKNCLTGLKVKHFQVNIPPSEIIDICTTKEKIYFLMYTKLSVLKLSNGKIHKFELPLRNYVGIVYNLKSVYLLTENCLKFDVFSKLVRKTNLVIRNGKVVTKSCFNDGVFILVNPDEKLKPSGVIWYQCVSDQMSFLQLKERVDFIGGALSFMDNNEIFIFGGKLAMGWASSYFFCIELQNLSIKQMKPMIKSGIFNVSSLGLYKNRVSAIDSTGYMHIYDRFHEKWKMISEKHWKLRRAVIWIWSHLKKHPYIHPLSQMSQGLFKRFIIEFLN